jgi:hypothetical protein
MISDTSLEAKKVEQPNATELEHTWDFHTSLFTRDYRLLPGHRYAFHMGLWITNSDRNPLYTVTRNPGLKPVPEGVLFAGLKREPPKELISTFAEQAVRTLEDISSQKIEFDYEGWHTRRGIVGRRVWEVATKAGTYGPRFGMQFSAMRVHRWNITLNWQPFT